MPRKRKKIDPSQMTLDLTFEEKVDRYVDERRLIQKDIDTVPAPAPEHESEFECCVEIAAATKRAMREAGIKREELVFRINEYFGRTEEGAKADPPTCRKPLTITYLNSYLSKPAERPIPAYYLFAIQAVCNSLAPTQAIVEPAGGKVVSANEVRHLTLGRIEANMNEMRKLKRELRK